MAFEQGLVSLDERGPQIFFETIIKNQKGEFSLFFLLVEEKYELQIDAVPQHITCSDQLLVFKRFVFCNGYDIEFFN